ncbi:E3 ubiquitin-protein ligase Rnf220 [Papilio xuthus]|uniref:E3 ubiquitin-protein ligase Rnf220 n=1 Tax=Papilio xuthus TaxID=66420 RepID=A0A0N1I4F0_PAPXU|nr:E3 ubiquitin-protein ligase Rnf220 [Papilio xuthus]
MRRYSRSRPGPDQNDEPSGGFGAEYQWCGEWRVRAAALQAAEGRVATAVRRVSNDQALVVDGDEDTELYGPPQYSPSRIAPDTRIQALKAKIKELESRQNTASEAKCLICLGPHISPAVSIQCWHVHCEVCWLQSLKAKKICPQCNAITSTQHLRRIYM